MIEKQFKLKHYIALGLLLIAIVISAIQPLEFEAYFHFIKRAQCLC